MELCRARFDDTEGGLYNLRYSVYVPSRGAYWVPHLKQYWRAPFGGDGAVNPTYPRLLASVPTNFILGTLYPDSSNTLWQTTYNQRHGDANLSDICAATRDKGNVTYTIAFQAPAKGRAAMRDCAGQGNERGISTWRGSTSSRPSTTCWPPSAACG